MCLTSSVIWSLSAARRFQVSRSGKQCDRRQERSENRDNTKKKQRQNNRVLDKPGIWRYSVSVLGSFSSNSKYMDFVPVNISVLTRIWSESTPRNFENMLHARLRRVSDVSFSWMVIVELHWKAQCVSRHSSAIS